MSLSLGWHVERGIIEFVLFLTFLGSVHQSVTEAILTTDCGHDFIVLTEYSPTIVRIITGHIEIISVETCGFV